MPEQGPPSGRRVAARKNSPCAAESQSIPTLICDEDRALCARFEQVIAQITLRIQQGGYVAEQCTMLIEIARISTASNCPAPLRSQAMELLLRLGRRSEHERPCTRGVREMIEQCSARGIVR